jgi:hypothetical protein
MAPHFPKSVAIDKLRSQRTSLAAGPSLRRLRILRDSHGETAAQRRVVPIVRRRIVFANLTVECKVASLAPFAFSWR